MKLKPSRSLKQINKRFKMIYKVQQIELDLTNELYFMKSSFISTVINNKSVGNAQEAEKLFLECLGNGSISEFIEDGKQTGYFKANSVIDIIKIDDTQNTTQRTNTPQPDQRTINRDPERRRTVRRKRVSRWQARQLLGLRKLYQRPE